MTKMSVPSAASNQRHQSRLKQAASMAGDTGVTAKWYSAANLAIESATTIASRSAAVGLVWFAIHAAPDSILISADERLQAFWGHLLDT
jgi:hypothetical protein